MINDIVKELHDNEWLMNAYLNHPLVNLIVTQAKYSNESPEWLYKQLARELYGRVVIIEKDLIEKIQNDPRRFTT